MEADCPLALLANADFSLPCQSCAEKLLPEWAEGGLLHCSA